MKSLLVVRHAKSSWDIGISKDFDRPLNDRGKRDAPAVARHLIKRGVSIDAFITSPAKRAKSTAKLFVATFGKNEEDIIYVPELYHASSLAFYHVVENIDDRFNNVALFSHNPGITDFVNSLTETTIDNMPTCGVFAIRVVTDSWKNFKEAPKTFAFFDFPKMLS